MKAEKVLFINQEVSPYVPDTPISKLGLKLSQVIQESGKQIRTFMPKWGCINERRNQLHEVKRLSGMNIIIDDTDHTLVIKVASVQSSHIQVYFIDNDDYFHKRGLLIDENGVEYPDNAERSIFYVRGVLETVKKLRWIPDVIHCQGWMSALAPMYIKTAYSDDPPYANAKVVFSANQEIPPMSTPDNLKNLLPFRNLNEEALNGMGIDFSSPDRLAQLVMKYSDGIILSDKNPLETLLNMAKEQKKPTLMLKERGNMADAHSHFYESLWK